MNDNQQAIQFVQNFARGAANATYSFYLTAKKFLAEWNALDIAAVIPNDSNVIQDGNSLQPVTDGQIQILQANLQTLVNTFEANSDLILNQTIVVSTSANSQV